MPPLPPHARTLRHLARGTYVYSEYAAHRYRGNRRGGGVKVAATLLGRPRRTAEVDALRPIRRADELGRRPSHRAERQHHRCRCCRGARRRLCRRPYSRRWSASWGASARPGSVLFVEQSDGNNLVTLADPADPGHTRQPTDLHCIRFYSSNGTTACLSVAGVGPTYAAQVLDQHQSVIRTIALPGIPSRARVSASGTVSPGRRSSP